MTWLVHFSLDAQPEIQILNGLNLSCDLLYCKFHVLVFRKFHLKRQEPNQRNFQGSRTFYKVLKLPCALLYCKLSCDLLYCKFHVLVFRKFHLKKQEPNQRNFQGSRTFYKVRFVNFKSHVTRYLSFHMVFSWDIIDSPHNT